MLDVWYRLTIDDLRMRNEITDRELVARDAPTRSRVSRSSIGRSASITESAGVGVIVAIASAAVRGELTRTLLREAAIRTMTTVGILLWLTLGANAFIGIYNIMGGTGYLRGLIGGLPLPPPGIVLVMMLILWVLGLIIDWIGICLLTMPIFVPVIKSLGYDPIWFGVLFCMNMQTSYLSPPEIIHI